MNAIEAQPVFGDRKPNMIIIDEIDGVAGGSSDCTFIKLLLDLVKAEPEVQEVENDGISQHVRKRKGKTQQHILMRPIICICNDL